jgi:hypothetical protein
MYIDNIAVSASYNNGLLPAGNIMDLTAGDHNGLCYGYSYTVKISAETLRMIYISTCYVDTGTQNTVTDRTFSATITDP